MRSDAYTITFTTIVTVILGLGLSYTADSLRDRQILNEELDIKTVSYTHLTLPTKA